MRQLILIASLTAAIAGAAAPGLASAQNACEAVKHDDKVVGTLLGAIGGAVLGDLVGGHGHKTDGAIVGAAGGAIVGNQLSRSKAPCPDGYVRYGYEEQRPAYVAPRPAYYGDDRYVRYDRWDADRRYNYRRFDQVDSYYDGAGRECRMVSRSYVAPDGDTVTRWERICR